MTMLLKLLLSYCLVQALLILLFMENKYHCLCELIFIVIIHTNNWTITINHIPAEIISFLFIIEVQQTQNRVPLQEYS